MVIRVDPRRILTPQPQVRAWNEIHLSKSARPFQQRFLATEEIFTQRRGGRRGGTRKLTNGTNE
jgi:hypothetical protein